MRVLVTGGTGLIGHALVMSLAHEGHEVVVISRNPRQAGPMPGTVSFAEWDAQTADGWGHLVDGVDAIVNLAGASIAGDGFLPTKWTRERKKLIVDSRVNAGRAVGEAVNAATNKPGVVIQASGIDYYGSDGDTAITEDHPAGTGFLADVCKKWEASVSDVEAMGVRLAVIRTAVVLSTEDGALPRQALPFKFFVGGPIGSGKQPVSWIHLEDEVRAIRFLIERPDASGPFNLTAPNPVTNKEFSQALGNALNRPSFVPLPGFAFKAAFGEVAQLLLEGQRAVPERLLDLGFEFQFNEIEPALNDLYKSN